VIQTSADELQSKTSTSAQRFICLLESITFNIRSDWYQSGKIQEIIAIFPRQVGD